MTVLIRKMQIKATIICYFISARLAKEYQKLEGSGATDKV